MNRSAEHGISAAILLTLSMWVAGLGGCTIFETTCDEADRDCLGAGIFAKGVGGACERDGHCKAGLFCVEMSCQPNGETGRGEACRLTAECGSEDYCGNKRLCQVAGVAEAGTGCQSTGGCRHGLVCEAADLSATGVLSLSAITEGAGVCTQGGSREEGMNCDATSDCLAGLLCEALSADDKRCINPPATPQERPVLPLFWEGVACEEPTSAATRESYFEVPDGEVSEFYRLPFPNDVRLQGGRPDLSGHPAPPSNASLPALDRYIQVAEEDLDGFSTNPVVFFRFSHPYDFDSVNGSSLSLIDITPGSPDYNADASLLWKTTSGNLSNYICPHWLAMRRPVGSPLRPDTTYAAIVRTSVRPASGAPSFERGRDLDAVLASAAPSQAPLKAAWNAYEPLRDWITDTGADPDTILNVAVFTTQSVAQAVDGMRAHVESAATPGVSELTRCASANTASPCEDAQGRGACQAASGDFQELHGRIRLPMYQAGTLPYAQPNDGGGFEFDGSGMPVVQVHRQVCMALSVPSTPPPADGYPVLIYGHGTGGSFTGQFGDDGYAQAAATASEPTVVIAIDLPMHGERRGNSDEAPDNLFFNFFNPRAARDNALQGAGDLLAVARFAAAGGISAADSPTGNAIPFDAARIAVMGHSQGATHASLMISRAPEVGAVVLSGNGAHLATSLLTKTSPVDVASALPFLLLDANSSQELVGGNYNPALALMQMVFDRADPINFARHVRRDPSPLVPDGQHLLMTYGLGDTFSTEATMEAYAQAARLRHVGPVLQDIGLTSAPAPASNTDMIGSQARTIGLHQYDPGSQTDGHFVATQKGQQGRTDSERFLEGFFSGQSPVIGQ